MESIAFPLNREHEWGKHIAQPDTLKLVDLGSRSMFGVFQDNQILSVKQFVNNKEHDLELISISTYDFAKKFGNHQ